VRSVNAVVDVVVRIRPEVVVGVRPENVIEEVVIGVRPEQRPEPADHDAAAPPGPERATEPTVESGPSEVRLPRNVADGTLNEDCWCARDVTGADDVAGASKAARVQGAHRGRSTPGDAAAERANRRAAATADVGAADRATRESAAARDTHSAESSTHAADVAHAATLA